jgi:hypothetical protein
MFCENTAGIQSLTGCPFGAQAGYNLIFYKPAAPDGGAYPGRCQGQIATAPFQGNPSDRIGTILNHAKGIPLGQSSRLIFFDWDWGL